MSGPAKYEKHGTLLDRFALLFNCQIFGLRKYLRHLSKTLESHLCKKGRRDVPQDRSTLLLNAVSPWHAGFGPAS